MLNISEVLIQELSLQPWQVANTLALLAEGGTVPFIARYRKERTGELNEIQLRSLVERFEYLTELEDRKATVLKSIEEQGKLTDDLRARIEACMQKTELEDLYLPYKPKKRTRATIAREKGLEPLADFIRALNAPEVRTASMEAEAVKFIDEEKGVASVQEALAGASDILAEEVSEKADLRAYVRNFMAAEGIFRSRVKDEFPEGTTKYEMYRDWSAPVRDIPAHNMLALRRGESEGVLFFDLEFEQEQIVGWLEGKESHSGAAPVRTFYAAMIKDAFERLMKHTLIGEVRFEKKQVADTASIQTFESNLRELLLSSPAGMKPTLGIDPGFRTGCKVVAIDRTGKFLENQTIYPHTGDYKRMEAVQTLRDMIERFGTELIAIGNGTAGRETDVFVAEVIRDLDPRPVKVIVNESGASIYSASDAAIDEFPELDLTIRGAISIGRRLMDPLAELVKIDPKSIGVGQYQHDVDQRLLKKKLDETVESCVNYVGVDLNTASKELLSYVAGLTSGVAKNVIQYRNEHGRFRSRKELLKVPRFGPKAFEQSAGFLRIRDGEQPLDNTAVHPESYHIVETIARDLNVSLERIQELSAKVKGLDIKRYVTEEVGEPTLRDIMRELEKPGRDPRESFRYAEFAEGVNEIRDLKPGMVLEGVVTNVANFGAFVDIGVHQDGLVHVSQLADRFIRDPKEVVKVGQIVRVTVVEVNEKLKRIGLSMKKQPLADGKQGKGQKEKPAAEPKFSLDDLKKKFGK
ncbi:MAG: RNA-binding transcriptional accessory protein [Bacteroidetes bacterium]|nr:RNA-binding transcriptional accessory protein [Bacteroidota bacterium]